MKNREGFARDAYLLAEYISLQEPADEEVEALVHDLAQDYGIEPMVLWEMLPEISEQIPPEGSRG